jgi:hypothetical protein
VVEPDEPCEMFPMDLFDVNRDAERKLAA